MGVSIHNRIKVLIEETNDAFSYCDSGFNADYPEFATLAFSDFKAALEDPFLTRKELLALLRGAMKEHRRQADPDANWSSFVAEYVAETSNSNVRQRVA